MTQRVLIASIMHETNTFCQLQTDMDSFRRCYDHRGEAVPRAFRNTRTEMGAFLDAAEFQGWSATTPIAAAATPSGKVTAAAWTELSEALLAALDSPVDGILLALHGAMVTEATDDAEGELFARIRGRCGEAVPIIVTLDLHANVTDRMAAMASGIIAYRSYPHVDMYERGEQAAALLARAMAGTIRPHCVVIRRPQLDGVDHGRTTRPGPMLDALKLAESYEREPGCLR